MPSSLCPATLAHATESGPIYRTFRYNSMSHFLLRDLANKSVTWEKVSFTSIGGKGKSICKRLKSTKLLYKRVLKWK